MFGLYELTPEVADGARALTERRFFGPTEREGFAGSVSDSSGRTRGLIEQAPHDLIHFAIGGAIGFGDPELEEQQGSTSGLMASVPTAAFDPVFWVHHSNIDRIWAVWECLPERTWGNLPAAAWFEEQPWNFFDADGSQE